ncbi:MAG: HYR domain-containing protein [Saprospiraceae bacterium]
MKSSAEAAGTLLHTDILTNTTTGEIFVVPAVTGLTAVHKTKEMFHPMLMLSVGNIQFTHVNSDDPEGWSFVTTTSIASGTVVIVTDNEWSGSAFDADGSDEVYTITFTSIAPCGTEFTFVDGLAPTSNNGSTASINDNTFLDLEAAGDALYLFDGSIGAPNFISAIKFGAGTWGNGGHNLPATLTNDITAIDFVSDNGEYSCGKGSLFSTVMNETYWTTSDVVITHSPCFWSCNATTLLAGDILFTHANSDAPDGWSFVLTKPVAAGKKLYVSENEWNGTSFNTGEETFVITFTSAASCGTEFAFQTGNAPVSNNGSTATINDNTFSFETGGEALYLLEPSLSGVNFISAISFGNGAWGSNGNLPSSLTNGTSAIDFSQDNGMYNCASGSGCGGGINIFTSGIMNDANWITNDASAAALNSFCTWSGCTAPICTVPLSPVNGATGVSIGSNLNWAAADCSSGYKIYLGTNNPPTNIVNGTNLGNVLSYDPVALLVPNTRYYWKIVPTNNVGDAVGCSVWSFVTNIGIPECTTPVFPPHESTGLPITSFNLTWNAEPTATSYLLYFGTNFPPTNIVNGVNQGNVTTHATGALLNNTTYYWRIQPVNSYGTASGCTNWSFKTTIAPLSFCLNCDGSGAACVNPGTINNPDFSALCTGFTIALVLDESGSLQGYQNEMENATMNFLNSLNCTGASVAIIEFNAQARFLVDDYTPVDDNYVTAAQSYFDDIPVPFMDNEIYQPDAYISDLQGTNWEAGMLAVDAIPFTPDLIIFLTDGVPTGYSTDANPTYNGPYDYCGDGTTTQTPEIVNPVKIANKLKVEGAHMFMVGVGNATLSTLQQMAGTTEFVVGTNGIGNSDYSTSNFSDLAQGLAEVVENLCPFAAEVVSQSICIGGTNGSVSITVPTQLFPFNYQYFNNTTNELLGEATNVSISPLMISGLAVGSYRIEVDVEVPGSNCTRTEIFYETIVANAPNVVAAVTSVVQPTCINPNIGSATLTISTGTPSFVISLKKEGVTQSGYPVETNTNSFTATGLNFGSYTFETTDANSCNTDIDAFTVNELANCCVPTCPANVTIQCGSSTTPAQTGAPTTIANCGTITYSDNITGGTCPLIQIITRTWVSSITGVICTQTITVMDNTAPSIICPANVTVSCAGQVPVVNTASVIRSDNCAGNVTVIHVGDVKTNQTCANKFKITRTYRATDACGNSATCSSTITVQDNTAPQIHCPSNLVLTCDAGQNYVALIYAWIATATATDACGVNVTITTNYDGISIPNFSCQGGLVITFTATDICGNSSSCTASIVKPCFSVETWVYLEGSAIDSGGQSIYTLPMRTALNDIRLLPGQALLDPFFGVKYSPPGQPYSLAPWNYPGTEGSLFDSGGNPVKGDAGYLPTVVDWVLVSLRLDSAGTAGPICQSAALLHNDGTIQFVKPLNCCGVLESANYYIVIEHRNHLIVMSRSKVHFVNHKLSYDFRFQQSWEDPLFAGHNLFAREREILPGIFAMFAGNGNQTSSLNSDSDINFDDRSLLESQNGAIGSYRTGDYNLNGDTNFNDRIVWERNNGKFTSVPRN